MSSCLHIHTLFHFLHGILVLFADSISSPKPQVIANRARGIQGCYHPPTQTHTVLPIHRCSIDAPKMAHEINDPMPENISSLNLKAFLKVVCLIQTLPKAYRTNNSIIDNSFCIAIFRSTQQSDILSKNPPEDWTSTCKRLILCAPNPK